MVAAMVVAMACVLLLVQHDSVRATSLDSVYVGNWRTDENYLPCEEDPSCGYGNINLDREAAYSNPSPLAIINDDYKEGQLNPYPGPRNFGPDSPVAWLPEEEMDDYPGMVRKVWPDYTGSENSISATSAAKSVGVQQLYMRRRPTLFVK
ncbi:hypothetical protein GUITHDRAFT_163361, partial [Guillardia theta CCMP2712]